MNRRRMMMLQTTDNKLYLYNYGDECIDVTGGWVEKGFILGTNRRTEKQENQMLVYADNFNDMRTATTLSTVNAIDIRAYNKIYIDWEVTNITSNDYTNSSLLTMEGIKNGNSYANSASGVINWGLAIQFANQAVSFSGISEMPYDIAKVAAPICHFAIIADVWSRTDKASSAQIIVRRVWLEK